MTKATGRPRGRPRKAVALATIHGDRARPAAAAVLPVAIDDAPAELNDEERDHWRQLAPELLRLGRLTVLSSPALSDLCRWLAMADMMHARISADGLTQTGQKGEQVRHPLLMPLATVAARIEIARNSFGMSPAANDRFPAVVAERSPSDDLLSGGTGTGWT